MDQTPVVNLVIGLLVREQQLAQEVLKELTVGLVHSQV